MPIQKAYEGKKLMYKFVVYKLSGTVQSENTRSETEVSGNIYGGGTNSTYGTTAPVRGEIKSETIRYQTIFLKEDDGTEHALELKDLVVPCREGHNKLNALMFPKVAYFVFGILFGIYAVDQDRTGGEYLLAFLFATLIGLAIATIPCGIIAGKRKSAVLAATTTPDMVLAK
jgi:hypothetical protein